MELIWFIRNSSTGLPVTEADEYTSVSIRRAEDGYLYDWSTNSFAVSGGNMPMETYTEITLLPGFYTKTTDTSEWDDGLYQVFSYLETPDIATTRAYEMTISNGTAYESPSEIALTTNTTPAATLLVQEYYNSQDLDGNGLIYGADFYISTGRPRILDQIPKKGVPFSWEDYLASV
jgi:hypothetical protein